MAMAYAALVSLSQVVDQLCVENQYFVLCRKQKIISLQKDLTFLQSFLQDRPIIGPLEIQIRDAAYEMQDVLESFISTLVLRDYEEGKRYDGFRSTFQSCTQSIESVVEEATKVMKSTDKKIPSIHSSSSDSSRDAPRVKDSSTVVGLEEDLNQIKLRVADQDPTLQIIPIVGMGGIGKTTLARSVYEDQLAVDLFAFRCWATVSESYNTKNILLLLLHSKPNNSDELGVESLIEQVYKMLKGRRYLIILDDMWHGEAWMRVRRAFPDDHNGSRVILTTRLSEVAAFVNSSASIHRMRLLNADESWSLLRNKVFGETPCPPQLQEAGEMIARSCKGLPLAIIVIAGLLKRNQAHEYWESVAKDVYAVVIDAADDDDRSIMGILSLSYNNLPPHLKPCFLFFAVYPEDYHIPAYTLIKLWVAEGFLKTFNGAKSLEEVGQEYLKDLVDRSLVMVTSKNRSGSKIKVCSMHDVLRELSLRKSEEEKFVKHLNDTRTDKFSFPQIIRDHHHVSMHTDGLSSFKHYYRTSPIRSVMFFGSMIGVGDVWFISQFRLLRVVDSLIIKSKVFPTEIFELVHLRHLEVIYDYNGKYCRIPSSISKLSNLQTLILLKGDSVRSEDCQLILPSQMWTMKHLRHLVLIRITTWLAGDDRSALVLHNLQTLTKVKNFSFTEKAVQRMPNLKKLRIHYSHDFDYKNWPQVHLHNLVHLHELEELTFRFHPGYVPTSKHLVPKDLSSFPKKLKKLTLIRSGIPWTKMSAIGSLPNLEVLFLRRDAFMGSGGIWKAVEGEFPQLRQLILSDLDLRIWDADNTHFPRLEMLHISHCHDLKEVPLEMGDIATLERLSIAVCNRKAEKSVRLIQEEQEDLGNNLLQVDITYTPKPKPKPKPEPEPEPGHVRRLGRTGTWARLH